MTRSGWSILQRLWAVLGIAAIVASAVLVTQQQRPAGEQPDLAPVIAGTVGRLFVLVVLSMVAVDAGRRKRSKAAPAYLQLLGRLATEPRAVPRAEKALRDQDLRVRELSIVLLIIGLGSTAGGAAAVTHNRYFVPIAIVTIVVAAIAALRAVLAITGAVKRQLDDLGADPSAMLLDLALAESVARASEDLTGQVCSRRTARAAIGTSSSVSTPDATSPPVVPAT